MEGKIVALMVVLVLMVALMVMMHTSQPYSTSIAASWSAYNLITIT